MGTINYRTSDFITLAVNPYNPNDFYNDRSFLEYAEEEGYSEESGNLDDFIYETIHNYYSDDHYQIESVLEKYDFYYFHVEIVPGYYEGFSIEIEHNFGIYYDDYLEKRDAQKEITQIKKFLLECAENNMVECWPGWITSYKSYEDTIKAISEATKEMRETVKNTPTWRQYDKECA